MNLPVRLTAAAVRDLARAEGWYLSKAPHVVEAFGEELDRTLGLISEGPGVHQVVAATVRRAALRRFPFLVFYRALR